MATTPTPVMQEIGYSGLATNSVWIQEDARRELQFPASIKTFDKMAYNSSVDAALKLIKTFFSRVEWIVTPYNNSDVHKNRAEFVSQCKDDMDVSWVGFVQEVGSFLKYGFSFHEIVARRRYKVNGSKFNDGYVGIKNLPIRSQGSIVKFHYDPQGRYLAGIQQVVTPITSDGIPSMLNAPINIPINRLLHFRTDSYKDSPVGTSCLVGCYETWKWLNIFREIEAIAISRNMAGVPHFQLPPEYMDADAPLDKKAVYEMCKKIGVNMNNGEQAALITPLFFDENGNKVFDFELLTAAGGASVDVGSIIERYTNELLQCLFADILQMGNNKVGSNNLADNKTSLIEMVVELRLQEIADVLNSKLIPFLFEANGWDTSKLPKFEHASISKLDIAEVAKALQQLAATGLLEIDRELLNYVCKLLGLPLQDEDKPVDFSILSNAQSRSGDSLNTASAGQNGTSDSVSPIDNSANNLSNK